jgi:ribosomal protein S17
MSKDVEIGDYVEIKECRPISKIIHFVCTGKVEKDGNKIKSGGEK